MAVFLPKSRLPELLVCGKIRTGEKIVKIRVVFAWIFAVCAMILAQPALAQADLACSGLSHTLVVNWPQFGFTPCGGRFNPNEFILSPTTVPNLELKWHQLYGDGGSASPAVMNGVMYVDADFYGENLDYLYAVDANTGMVLWSKARGTQGPSSPAVANGLVFIGDLDNSVYAFDARTGAPVWKVTTGNEVWGSPTVANGIVYIISGDGNIYALDAAGGAVLWMKAVSGSARSSPEIRPSPAAWCISHRVLRTPAYMQSMPKPGRHVGASITLYGSVLAGGGERRCLRWNG